MQHVVIVIHLMLVLALIGVVLLQKSEGGGLGIGSTGGLHDQPRHRQRADPDHRDPGRPVLRHQPDAVDPRRHQPQADVDPAGGQPGADRARAPNAPLGPRAGCSTIAGQRTAGAAGRPRGPTGPQVPQSQ